MWIEIETLTTTLCLLFGGVEWTIRNGSQWQQAHGCSTNLLAIGLSFSMRDRWSPQYPALDALYKQDLHTEFLHPVLAPLKSGPGRRPELDLAVIGTYPQIVCAVESKWVGVDGIKIEDVVWDLIRLELVAHQAKADAFFVLAGRRKHLKAFFASKAFFGKKRKPGGPFRTILKMRSQPRMGIRHPAPEREGLFQKLFADYQDVSFPDALATTVAERYPEICPNFQYQAYAWRVHVPPKMGRFYPRDHKLYGISQS
jgi:hypothetical protein